MATISLHHDDDMHVCMIVTLCAVAVLLGLITASKAVKSVNNCVEDS